MSRQLILSAALHFVFVCSFAQTEINLDRFESVYIEDLVFGNVPNELSYIENEGFHLLDIVKEKLEARGVPISQERSPLNCKMANCYIFCQADSIYVTFEDCNSNLIFYTGHPFHLNPTVGTNEIPKIRTRIQAALRNALTRLDNYSYKFNPDLPPLKLNLNQVDFSLDKFKDSVKSSLDSLEGIYENTSLDFPSCKIGIKEELGKYTLFYVEADEILGMPNAIVSEFYKNDKNSRYEGIWKFRDGSEEAFSIKIVKNKKILVDFTNWLEEPVVFKKKYP